MRQRWRNGITWRDEVVTRNDALTRGSGKKKIALTWQPMLTPKASRFIPPINVHPARRGAQVIRNSPPSSTSSIITGAGLRRLHSAQLSSKLSSPSSAAQRVGLL